MLAANVTAALFELDGAGPLLVDVPVEEPDEVAAAEEEDVDEDEDEVRVAMLIVLFLLMAVPVAAEPEPTAPVPAAAVVVALPAAVLVPLPLLEPPPTTPPEAGLVGTDEVVELAAEEAEARAETATVGPLV